MDDHLLEGDCILRQALKHERKEMTAMEDLFARVWNDLMDRISGPMTFRLYLQPAMAIFFAIRDGMKDAREGRPFYFHSLLHDPQNRGERLREGFNAVARVFVLAIIMDLIYQLIVLRWFYPGEALIVAFILAFIPYLLLRGAVNRIARHFAHKTEATGGGR
jgi:hypothetical protein